MSLCSLKPVSYVTVGLSYWTEVLENNQEFASKVLGTLHMHTQYFYGNFRGLDCGCGVLVDQLSGHWPS